LARAFQDLGGDLPERPMRERQARAVAFRRQPVLLPLVISTEAV